MTHTSILKPLSCLIAAMLSLSATASDSVADMQPFTVLLSNAITQENGNPLDISHAQVRIGPGDGWTDIPDLKGYANSSQSVFGKRGSKTGLLRITLKNGQRYAATFSVDSNFMQLTMEPAISAGNKAGSQYELHTSTAVTEFTPVPVKGNTWAAWCAFSGVVGGTLICQVEQHKFANETWGFGGGIMVAGRLSSDANTLAELMAEPPFIFDAGGIGGYMHVDLHDLYHSHIDGVMGGFGGAKAKSGTTWYKD